MNISEIDDALSDALNSLAAAQATLRKSLPGRSIDVIRKANGLAPPRTSFTSDAATKALAQLADLERRATAIETARALDAQHTTLKTYTIQEVAR
jgi:hypothetical protein